MIVTDMGMEAELAEIFQGELISDEPSLDIYSHDASLFELRPKLIAIPRDVADI